MYHQSFSNFLENFYLFGKIKFVVQKKTRKFKGTNQYKKEDKNTKSFLKTVILVVGYSFHRLTIQICSLVQKMVSFQIGKCECTFVKLKCVRNRLRSTMGQEMLNKC